MQQHLEEQLGQDSKINITKLKQLLSDSIPLPKTWLKDLTERFIHTTSISPSIQKISPTSSSSRSLSSSSETSTDNSSTSSKSSVSSPHSKPSPKSICSSSEIMSTGGPWV